MRISERPPALAVVEKTNPPVGAGPNDDVLGDAILFNSVMLEFYLRNLVPGLFKGLLSGRKKFSFASWLYRLLDAGLKFIQPHAASAILRDRV